MRCVGIDPGSTTALVCLDVPMGRLRPDLSRGRWVGHAVVHPSASKRMTEPERKASLAERVAGVLREWKPDVVVLEEPVDAMPKFGAVNSRGISGHGRGTLFSLGAHYGLAVMGARIACPDARLYAYPVNNHGKGAARRPGWMQGGASRPQKRDDTMERMRSLALSLRCPDHPRELSEDVLMALGVAAYHLTHHEETAHATAA